MLGSGDTEEIVLHPAVEEWLYWKNDQPLTVPIGEMDVEVGFGLRYLMAKYGKQGKTEAQSYHEKMAQMHSSRVDPLTGMVYPPQM